MSFVHREYVGHFDPSEPIVLSKPIRPKPTKALDAMIVADLLKQTDHGIERRLYMDDVYLVCEWTRDVRVAQEVLSPFIHRLADRTGAVLMSQYGEIYYPAEAKTAYATWAQRLLE